MQEIELPAGIIEYEDTGGSGPVVVLLHGLAIDGSLWHHVVRELRSDHRCVVPTLISHPTASPGLRPSFCKPWICTR